ncbi:hypothetical protein FQA47_016176 [Oryzias melastigma]|uniref:Uncharacterized protein n=1 Tax=Oryzias melastigma TaxID=30732 RepID=A0A834FSL2_ORYME|nr:hypothetical protein FQA47_016176 [Oryzias melastigma]
MPRPFQSIKSSAEEGRGHAGSGTAASVRPSACTDVEMKLHEEFRNPPVQDLVWTQIRARFRPKRVYGPSPVSMSCVSVRRGSAGLKRHILQAVLVKGEDLALVSSSVKLLVFKASSDIRS